MTYTVVAPVNPAVDPVAQANVQAFFDSLGGLDNLPPFLDGVVTSAGGFADVSTSLYVLAELASGLATVGAFGTVQPYMVTSAAFLNALSDALLAANR